MSGGFRDEEDDFSDLLSSNTIAQSQIMSMSNTGYSYPTEDEDLSTNPFADMESSRIVYEPTRATSYSSQPQPEDGDRDSVISSSAASPISHDRRRFEREDAPEPESRPYSNQSSNYDTYSSNSPTGGFSTSPLVESHVQTPFGSPPPSSPSSHDQSFGPKKTAAFLLGEEKPILPTFRREANVSTASQRAEQLLPVSSIGNKAVGGALATLLGLEADEVEEKTKLETKESEVDKAGLKTEDAIESTSILSPSPAPLDPGTTHASLLTSSSATLKEASSVPLPPTPAQTPPPTNKSPEDEKDLTPQASTSTREIEAKLDNLVLSSATPTTPSLSPVITSPITPSYRSMQTSLFSDDPSARANRVPATNPDGTRPSLFGDEATSPTRGFRTFNDDSMDTGFVNEPPRINRSEGGGEGGFNGTVVADDGASMRANYSTSLREKDDLNNGASNPGTGSSSPALTAERNLGDHPVDREESLRTVGGGAGSDRTSMRSTIPESPPLPAVPLPITRNSQASDVAALGPSFIISVGDPQKIGSSLNVAAQHTVYTVRTKTTSSAFRKPEFTVLRRFSHFLWLFDALTLNNPGVIVPGMPEKSALGRFGPEFVENRRSALEAALMKIVAHPMLVGDPDLRLFLESDSFSVDIKQRRLDSPTESKGFLASLGNTLAGPKFQELDEFFDNRKQTLENFESHLRSLLAALAAAAKLRTTLQTSLGELQSAFLGLSQCDLSSQLRGALEQSAAVQRQLRELSEKQSISEEQIGGITSVAEGYARLCGSVKLVFGARIKAYHTWQAAESNLRKIKSAHEKAKRAGRGHSDLLDLSLQEISEAERKNLDAHRDFDDVSKLTKAEMSRFDKEKVEDFKKAVEDYAEGMVLRQREVVVLWQNYTDFLTRLVDQNAPPPLVPGEVVTSS